MRKNLQVGPYLMDVLHIIMRDDLLEKQLDPRRHTHHESNVPFARHTCNFFELQTPVALCGDFLAWLVIGAEPARDLLDLNTT
ncbi:hypothetical protein D3C87_1871840 [compost metagenome]